MVEFFNISVKLFRKIVFPKNIYTNYILYNKETKDVIIMKSVIKSVIIVILAIIIALLPVVSLFFFYGDYNVYYEVILFDGSKECCSENYSYGRVASLYCQSKGLIQNPTNYISTNKVCKKHGLFISLK